jgi:hypothetical protein
MANAIPTAASIGNTITRYGPDSCSRLEGQYRPIATPTIVATITATIHPASSLNRDGPDHGNAITPTIASATSAGTPTTAATHWGPGSMQSILPV